jgi:hypothetical protein
MFLADKFRERARSHPRRERRSGVCRFNLLGFLEQVLHARNYGALLMQAIVPHAKGPSSCVARKHIAACAANAR